jgi:hypothetical protein
MPLASADLILVEDAAGFDIEFSSRSVETKRSISVAAYFQRRRRGAKARMQNLPVQQITLA